MAKDTTSSPVAVYSLLAAGTIISGDIQSVGDLRLDGKMDGNLVCQGKVILGNAAVLMGNLQCAVAEISGMVTGDVEAIEQLILRGQSKIEGNIRTSSLIVEPGSHFNGLCEMIKSEPV